MMPPSKSQWVLLAAFLSLAVPAHADVQQGQRDCAALRSTVLQLVGDWSKDMLFASRDMDRNGWLDANVAHAAFKDVQIAVMHFDYAYEIVPKTRDACRKLASQFGMEVGTYIEEVMATGKRPEIAMEALLAQWGSHGLPESANPAVERRRVSPKHGNRAVVPCAAWQVQTPFRTLTIL